MELPQLNWGDDTLLAILEPDFEFYIKFWNQISWFILKLVCNLLIVCGITPYHKEIPGC